MRKFLRRLWSVIVSPFKKFHGFLAYEPEDRPAGEVIAAAIEQPREILKHIKVLRKHLLRILIILAVAVGISFAFTRQLMGFLVRPLPGGLDALKAIEVTESVGVFMRVAMLTGITLAVPYIAFELLLFIAPGLKARSRRIGLLGIPLAAVFFVGGMAFAFLVSLPAAIPFLQNFMDMRAEWRPQSYFNFVTGLMFWMGLAFEFPLVIYFLTAMGIVQPKFLLQQWRLAILLIAVIAAAITPTTDLVNMTLVMAPVIALYFVSILFSYIALASRRKWEEAQAKTG